MHGWSVGCTSDARISSIRRCVIMKRYEVRRISQNWFCIYDNIKCESVIESTSIGIKVYAEILGINKE